MGIAVPISPGNVRSALREKDVIRVRGDQSPEEANGATLETVLLLMEELLPSKPIMAILYGEGNSPIGAIDISQVVSPEDTGEFDGRTLVKSAGKERWRQEIQKAIGSMFPPDDRDKWKRAHRITLIASPS